VATTNGPDVGALLQRLEALATGEDRALLTALGSRLRERRFRVLVVGEAKRGKSTLINALLDRELLPTGVTPVTALPTVVRHGDREQLQVSYLDGRVEYRPTRDLAELVTESRNPDNRQRLAEVVVQTPGRLLERGIDLVDTPGVGSVFAHSAAAATAALDTMDAALFVLAADPPISGSERAFLSAVRERSVALFCVLNKVDNLTADERGEVLDFTADVLSAAMGRPMTIYPVSARQALAAGQPGDAMKTSGLPVLRAGLAGYLREHRAGALVASVAGHAARLAARLLDAAILTQRAAELTASEAGDQVARFSDQLAALDDHRRDATDVARASTGRLLADLNDAATWDTPWLTSRLRGQLSTWLDARADMPAARLEDQARAYAITQIEDAVDGWRREREQMIVDGLSAVDARLTATLERQIQGVRRAARDLLDIDLAIPVPAGRLLPEVGVSYAFDEEIGTTTQWEGAVRRHLPGRWGRRAVRAHLLNEVDSLVGKQMGRIRSRFQQALRPATTALIRAIEARYTEATAGLVQAVTAARDLAESPDTGSALRNLASRIADLRELAQALGAIRKRESESQVTVGGGG
jgi:GTPase Era involved in 16S rRNA processing